LEYTQVIPANDTLDQ